MNLKTLFKQWKIFYKDCWNEGIENGEKLGGIIMPRGRPKGSKNKDKPKEKEHAENEETY